MPAGQLYAATTGTVVGMVAALTEATGTPRASVAMTAAKAATRLLRNMMRLPPSAGRSMCTGMLPPKRSPLSGHRNRLHWPGDLATGAALGMA
jgi:hypothetical protein